MLSGKLFQSIIVRGKNSFESMLQMWMVGCNVDDGCAACNESMWRADNVVEF